MKKRWIDLALALCLALSLLPAGALAAGEEAVPPEGDPPAAAPAPRGAAPAEETPDGSHGSSDAVYAVTGGNLYFDSATGTITDCDSTVTKAAIPSAIGGVSVTGIKASAFGDCGSLTAVTIPAGVTSIGENAFSGCGSLTAVTVNSGNPAFSSRDGVLFNKNKTILICCPAGKTGTYGIPGSVTSIEDWAFDRCGKLTGLTIPGSVTDIGRFAFDRCGGLTAVTIPNGVTSIPYAAFDECRGLTSVTIPASVTSIEDWAFSSCSSLADVTIPGSVTSIGYSAFSSCHSLTAVTIPGSVTSIGHYAFSNCSGLTSVTIPDSVKSIGFYAFDDCTSLTSVTIPNGVTGIGDGTFADCSSLKTVTIPASVVSIGSSAFVRCGSLTDVWYTGTREQWQAIGIQYNNEPLTSASFHFGSAPPAITAQPQDVTVAKAGDKASFTVAAQGDHLTYTWYYRNLGASKWTKSSLTGPKFTLIISQDREVKCEVTGSGVTVTSAVARGLVPDNTVLNLLPDATQVANPSDKVSFQVTGGSAPYTWYYHNAGANTWSKSAVTGNKFSLVVSRDREVYCVSADGKQSAVATASIAQQGSIQVTPQVGVAAKAGGRVTFTATGGTGPYAWYYRNAGALTWSKSSVTTNKFAILVGKDREVFCASGDARSEVVTATVGK